MSNDPVNHPAHYTSGPRCECGRVIEAITITRPHTFARGNAVFPRSCRTSGVELKRPRRVFSGTQRGLTHQIDLTDWRAVMESTFQQSENPKPVKRPRRLCSFTGCVRGMHAHKLCVAHLAQRDAGTPLRAVIPRRARGSSMARDERGRKWCGACEAWLEEDRFAASRTRIDGLYFHCRDCERSTQLKIRYNITRERFDEMFAAQGRVCGICGTDSPGHKTWTVDHDHACCGGRKRSCGECVRGILCHRCNTGLGLFGDDPASLASAIEYLQGATA